MLTQMENLNEDCVKIPSPYLLYVSRDKPSKSTMVGSGRLFVLNDSVSSKMVIQIFLPIFLKGFSAV